MIVYPSLPSGHTIFCDDVRHEIGGKQTYVGVYGPTMYVSEIPALLPQIYCVVSYRESPDFSGTFVIRAISEVDDDETILAEIEIDVPESDKPPPEMAGPFIMREGKFVVQLAPFNIEGPGLLKVRAFRGDDEIRLGALKIGLLPSNEPSEDPEDDD